jgi:hypothetical protein
MKIQIREGVMMGPNGRAPYVTLYVESKSHMYGVRCAANRPPSREGSVNSISDRIFSSLEAVTGKAKWASRIQAYLDTAPFGGKPFGQAFFDLKTWVGELPEI